MREHAASGPTAGGGATGPKPERYGRYLLLDRIDVGGMAEVFRGRMAGVEGFERMVALKRILPNIAADPDFVDMFVDEAKLAVQLQHANIAQIFELGKVDESYFIAMEYVSGVSLRTMWDRARARNRLLPIAMSCHILQKVCEGLDAAHRKKDERTGEDIGLVHRDVSPQNVLVSFEGEVKVIDFGIAKAANKVSKTQAGVLKGKFGYMSPEQVRGIELDNRSDIFACGVMLHELLVGDRLFLGESDFSTLEKIRSGDVVPPTRLNKNLSPQLEAIVMKALSRGREDRYRWAAEMAEELQRYLFSTNQPFARTDLQKYMQQHFRAEIAEEKRRLETYREIQRVEEEKEPMTEVGVGALQSPVGGAPPVAPPPVRFDFEPSEPTARGTTALLDVGGPSAPSSRLPTWAAVVIGILATLLVLGGAAAALALSGLLGSTGALDVEVWPDQASVFFDDRLVAKGSTRLEGLDPGTHVLGVQHPGYREVLQPVRIEGGQTRMMSVRLTPISGDAGLSVRSDPPGFTVIVDGVKLKAPTPVRRDDLAPGIHAVELRAPDGGLVLRRELRLRSGESKSLEVDVASLPPRLEVRSSPEGAEVRVNGMLRGRTPLSLDQLPAGEARVEVRKAGCKSAAARPTLVEGRVLELDVPLACSPGD